MWQSMKNGEKNIHYKYERNGVDAAVAVWNTEKTNRNCRIFSVINLRMCCAWYMNPLWKYGNVAGFIGHLFSRRPPYNHLQWFHLNTKTKHDYFSFQISKSNKLWAFQFPCFYSTLVVSDIGRLNLKIPHATPSASGSSSILIRLFDFV